MTAPRYYDTLMARADALRSDPAYLAAVSAYRAAPSPDTSDAVSQRIAFAVSPEMSNGSEVEARYTGLGASGVACAQMIYARLTERALGIEGLFEAVVRDNAPQWERARELFLRDGVPVARFRRVIKRKHG